jgi:glycosyltransferase involved in cell wall biosynthesis
MQKVSVILPVYNGARYIAESVTSVLNQTFTDFELIIINDGSSDNTSEILKTFTDSRIVLIQRENRGLIDTLNEGLAFAHGEYVARMDADDVMLPERLAKQVAYLDDHPRVAVLGGWAEVINESGEKIGFYDYPPTDYHKLRTYILKSNPFIHSTVMFRREVILRAGGYRQYRHIEDYELWTRVVFKYQGTNLPEPLIKYRVHLESITSKNRYRMLLLGILVRLLALQRFAFRF